LVRCALLVCPSAPVPLVVGGTWIGGAGLSFLIGIAGSWPLLSAKPAQALRSL